MNDKNKPLDIYLMGIAGTGMGAFAGLLKEKGFLVRGSDDKVYSPMKEKLLAWNIPYKTPYSKENLKEHPDLVIIGNVIKKDNEESQYVLEKKIPYDSFPLALKKLFLEKAHPIVVTGTHGKTTTSTLLAHTIKQAGLDLGFLIGGIPLNFNESFMCPKKDNSPFVVEGDEYDTAFFDKGPKFMHYCPKFLLTTSIEFDHADIYNNIDNIINSFNKLYKNLDKNNVLIVNKEDKNIEKALKDIDINFKIFSYGLNGNYQARNISYNKTGTEYDIYFDNKILGKIFLNLYGEHNLKNSLGAYGILHQFGLSHEKINQGFSTFLGVKRRLEVLIENKNFVVLDDFAHHPTAIKETLKAVKQKYPHKKIWAIFEPRSATSSRKVFENEFSISFDMADRVFITPVGRDLPKDILLDTQKVAKNIKNGKAYQDYESLIKDICENLKEETLVLMTNGDLMGHKGSLIEKLKLLD